MRILVLNAVMLLSVRSFCQVQDTLPKIIFGFNFGLNYSNLYVKSVDPRTEFSNAAGYRFGLLMNARLGKRLAFSPKAELSFNRAQLTFYTDTYEKLVYEVYPVSMEGAAHFTYSFGKGKVSPYILLGPSLKFPVKGEKKIRYATLRSDIAIDVGIGINSRLKTFDLAPELRYSMGLVNLREVSPVKQLYFHTVSMMVNFKG